MESVILLSRPNVVEKPSLRSIESEENDEHFASLDNLEDKNQIIRNKVRSLGGNIQGVD